MNRLSILAIIIWATLIVRVACEEWWRSDLGPDTIRVPLSQLPMNALGPGWSGEESPLSERVVGIAGVSDHVNRAYTQRGTRLNLYVGFVGGGATGGVHHPEVCFSAHGLELESRDLLLLDGGKIDGFPGEYLPELRFNEFSWSRPGGTGRAYSLSTFCYNRRLDPDVDRLRLASRYPGVPFHVSVILVGDYTGSPENTRRVYSRALRNLLPRLLTHF